MCIYYFSHAGSSLLCRLFLAAGSRNSSLAVVCGLLLAAASPAAEHWALGCSGSVIAAPRLWSTGSILGAHGLSCFKASGIFPDQRSNPCLLHWQTDSSPRSHQESPLVKFWFLSLAIFCFAHLSSFTDLQKFFTYSGCQSFLSYKYCKYLLPFEGSFNSYSDVFSLRVLKRMLTLYHGKCHVL